jgi:hypothetical protein
MNEVKQFNFPVVIQGVFIMTIIKSLKYTGKFNSRSDAMGVP